jgi:peptidoglycan lytic transglycosylase
MRRRLAEGLAVLLSVASLGAGAASGPNSSEAAKVVKPTGAKAVSRQSAKQIKNSPYQVGTASWYGEYFQGKETASGEPFDMQALTAAHPTLPLGSFVRVTNLRNGRAIVVRINDRGPVVEGRIIDVSYNTARILGFHEKGLQRVRLDLVRPASMARLQTVASLQ